MHFQIPVTYLVWKHPYNCTSLFEIKHSMNLGEHRTHLPVKKAMWAIPLAWEVATKGLTLRPTIRYCGENIWTCRVDGHAQGIYLRVGMDQEGKEHASTQKPHIKTRVHKLIENKTSSEFISLGNLHQDISIPLDFDLNLSKLFLTFLNLTKSYVFTNFLPVSQSCRDIHPTKLATSSKNWIPFPMNHGYQDPSCCDYGASHNRLTSRNGNATKQKMTITETQF